MRTSTKLATLVALTASLAMIGGCGGKKTESPVGTYASRVKGGKTETTPKGALTLADAGTYTMDMGGKKSDGAWVATDKAISFTPKSGSAFSLDIAGNGKKLKPADNSMVWFKTGTK
ncbi:hypothetical protein BH11ARM1_BH11ARM1_09180 [soil metagenome]